MMGFLLLRRLSSWLQQSWLSASPHADVREGKAAKKFIVFPLIGGLGSFSGSFWRGSNGPLNEDWLQSNVCFRDQKEPF